MENSSFGLNASNPGLPFSDLSNNIFRALIYSEWDLILFMGWTPTEGGTPPPDLKQHGNIEFGVILFLLNNPSFINDVELQLAVDLIVSMLSDLPSSNISVEDYNSLQNSHYIYMDGSLVATSPYALFDQNWMIALCNFILTMIENAYFNNGQLPLPAYTEPLVVTPWNPSFNRFTLALLADWGTGTSEAISTLNSALLQVPDCIIHLGDVYYSGSPVSNPGLPGYVHSGEEVNNFLNLWPTGWAGRSFTLNSNHEMYCGANGLFLDILQPSTPFNLQGGNTMFAISVGDWTILGLDSAYYADAGELFMYGSLAPNPTAVPNQITWIQSLNLNPGKTIVLTHHNGLDFNCDPESQESLYSPFWSQVNQALGGDPYAWYWGHVHNGIVYTNPVTINNNQTTWTTNTYCRCLGNGSMPYGTASEFVNNASPNIEWYAGQGNSVQELPNGYVILSFEVDDGVVQHISENFYLGVESVFIKNIF